MDYDASFGSKQLLIYEQQFGNKILLLKEIRPNQLRCTFLWSFSSSFCPCFSLCPRPPHLRRGPLSWACQYPHLPTHQPISWHFYCYTDISHCSVTIWFSVTPFSAVQIFEILNRIITSVFNSKRVQLFKIFEYLPSPISYLKKLKKASILTEWRRFFTLATTPSNQQNQCYIGPLWPTKYWNSYNRNHNSAVP